MMLQHPSPLGRAAIWIMCWLTACKEQALANVATSSVKCSTKLPCACGTRLQNWLARRRIYIGKTFHRSFFIELKCAVDRWKATEAEVIRVASLDARWRLKELVDILWRIQVQTISKFTACTCINWKTCISVINRIIDVQWCRKIDRKMTISNHCSAFV